jgi:hypothetical protein
VRRNYLSELGEDVGLEIYVFLLRKLEEERHARSNITYWHGLNDKVYAAKIFKLCAGCDALPRLGCFILCYPLFAHIFCKQLVWP